MGNPYPEYTGDVMSGRPLRSNAKHTIWQQGSDAKEKEAQGLYEALRKVMNDYPLAHYTGNNHPCTHCTALKAIARWEDK